MNAVLATVIARSVSGFAMVLRGERCFVSNARNMTKKAKEFVLAKSVDSSVFGIHRGTHVNPWVLPSSCLQDLFLGYLGRR